jgi:transposase InsO family protein
MEIISEELNVKGVKRARIIGDHPIPTKSSRPKSHLKQLVDFVREAQRLAPFKFSMLQSDHGPEFGKWFAERIQKNHRYTRIGKPNDNAHIERVNRTIQEECLDKLPNNVFKINCVLKKYLQYYNYKRVHGGINYLIPMQVV